MQSTSGQTRHSYSQQKLLPIKASKPKDQGFVLALVVIVGLILAAGAMALMARFKCKISITNAGIITGI